MKLTPVGPIDITRASGTWAYGPDGPAMVVGVGWDRWWSGPHVGRLNRVGMILIFGFRGILRRQITGWLISIE